jgi:hypothetical protein
MTFVLSGVGRQAACNGFVDSFDAAGAAIVVRNATNAEVCSFVLGASPFGGATTGGVSTLGSSPSDTSPAGGAPNNFVMQDSASASFGAGSAGTGGDLVIAATIATSDTVQLTAFTVTVPAS